MKISRDNQTTLVYAALRLLARAICAVSAFDKCVASDVETLGDGFSLAVCAGLGKNAPTVGLTTENGRFIRTSAETGCADVVIRFKDTSGLIPVITGRKSVETAFAQHRMLVFGNINQAVALVRIIGVTEAYLFPKFIIKKVMRQVPKKQVPGLFIYIALLFFGVRKPPALASAIEAEPDAPPEAIEEKILNQDNEAEERLEAVK